MKIRIVFLLSFILSVAFSGYAQNYSNEVVLSSLNGNIATVEASALAQKKKDAEQLALKSAIYAILVYGVDGLNGGAPMVMDLRKDYLYRLMNENRYLNFITGAPATLSSEKIAGMQKATVRTSVNIKNLKDEMLRNKMTLNPQWDDASTIKPTAAINPVIVVVPYSDSSYGYSFESLRKKYERDDLLRYVIDQITGSFKKNGYKTYNFINILEDSKTSSLLRDGTATDDATMIVQQMPGDIIVTAETQVSTDRNNISEVALHVKAFEKQTSANLASQSFSSGRLHTADKHMLANHAVDKIQKDFFRQLDNAFAEMVQNGREIMIELNLSEGIDDWDFNLQSPQSGKDFKVALENWLRSNAVRQRYDMSRSTGKYIRISAQVPIWNHDNNQPATLTDFNNRFRDFLKQELGDMYSPSITSMGQKTMVTIE